MGHVVRQRMGRAWSGFNRLVEHGSQYVICFGPLRGPAFFLLGGIGQGTRHRTVRVAVPGSARSLLVRLGTPDIDVFNEIYRGHEHDWDLPDAPRSIVDAGAYTGLTTAFYAMRYPEAQVIALEPGAENFALLLRNTSGLDNVRAVQAALWSKSGRLALTDAGREAWGLVVSEPEADRPGSGSVVSAPVVKAPVVEALALSDLLHQYGVDRVQLLKLDVEGSEVEIFSDAGRWIDRVDGICIELHDRFRPGCSRAFYSAVGEFPVELRSGEKILVTRK
jgi:FkbM family methyltransferase